MSEFDWFVGLFEGEGCIQFSWNKQSGGYYTIRLTLSMTDEDVLRRVLGAVEYGKVFGPYQRTFKGNKCKDIWTWQLATKDEVTELLWRMYPLLGQRRQVRAFEALELLEYGTGELS